MSEVINKSQGFCGQMTDLSYVPKADMTLEQFEHEVGLVMHMQRWVNWALGDLLLFGEKRWPERYKQAMVITGKSEQHLYNTSWVSKRFPPERRRTDLTWSHHLEVAGLADAEQDRWLTEASENHWTRKDLRLAREGRLLQDAPPSVEVPNTFTTAMRDATAAFINIFSMMEPDKDEEIVYSTPWGEIRLLLLKRDQDLPSPQDSSQS